ncbi:Hypothetical predicted protein, partial [Octopus vulgaris]
ILFLGYCNFQTISSFDNPEMMTKSSWSWEFTAGENYRIQLYLKCWVLYSA